MSRKGEAALDDPERSPSGPNGGRRGRTSPHRGLPGEPGVPPPGPWREPRRGGAGWKPAERWRSWKGASWISPLVLTMAL